MVTEKVKILIVDDHSIVREGIIKSLAHGFPDAEFGEAANTAEVMQKIHEIPYNIVILDINLPGRNGMEVLKDIKESYPESKVIIFSMYPEDQFAVRAIKAGASAYLTKDIPAKNLVEAVGKILRGERYLTPTMAELFANEISDDNKRMPHEILSDREYQVFLLIASGKNVTDIGNELNLSVKTISVYRSNIIKKMKLKNNSEIMHYAFRNKLVH